MKKKMGRPPIKDEKQKLISNLTVKFREAELARVHSAAKRAGFKVGTWARNRLLEAS